MFEKFESWTFSAPGPSELFQTSWKFWGERGYRLAATSPTSFQGRSFHSRLGLHRVVDVTILPSGAGAIAQLRYRADVTEAGAAGGVVLAVVLFPVAVVGGAISWHTYQRDFEEERWAFWNVLSRDGGAQPAPGTVIPVPPMTVAGTPPPSAPPATNYAPGAPAATSPPPATPPLPVTAPPSGGSPVCKSCGAPLAGQGRFCASCGTAAG